MAEQWENRVVNASDGPTVSEEEAQDTIVRAWLKRNDVVHSDVFTIAMHLIDTKRSRDNQARANAIVPESVERFVTALKEGAVFPPIVVYASGSGKDQKLIIIDGNNRHEAHLKARAGSIRGILISDKTPSEMIQRLTVEANTPHGVTPDQAWRVQQARHLIKQGWTGGQAAKAAGISIGVLNFAEQVAKANLRASELRLRDFDKLTDTHKKHLGALKDDEIFFQAARVAIDTNMITAEVAELVRQLKTQGSEEKRLKLIGQVKDQREIAEATRKVLNRTGSNRNSPASPKMTLVAGIGKVLAVDVVGLQRGVLTDADKEYVVDWLDRCEERVMDLKIAMEQVKVAKTDG